MQPENSSARWLQELRGELRLTPATEDLQVAEVRKSRRKG